MQAINPNFVNLILNAQTQLAQHTHGMNWLEPSSNHYQPCSGCSHFFHSIWDSESAQHIHHKDRQGIKEPTLRLARTIGRRRTCFTIILSCVQPLSGTHWDPMTVWTSHNGDWRVSSSKLKLCVLVVKSMSTSMVQQWQRLYSVGCVATRHKHCWQPVHPCTVDAHPIYVNQMSPRLALKCTLTLRLQETLVSVSKATLGLFTESKAFACPLTNAGDAAFLLTDLESSWRLQQNLSLNWKKSWIFLWLRGFCLPIHWSKACSRPDILKFLDFRWNFSLKAGVHCSFNNHDSLGTASQASRHTTREHTGSQWRPGT